MRGLLRLFAVLASVDVASAQAAKAVARMAASSGNGLAVSGSVTFEQTSPLGDMTVGNRLMRRLVTFSPAKTALCFGTHASRHCGTERASRS